MSIGHQKLEDADLSSNLIDLLQPLAETQKACGLIGFARSPARSP
jgi:hypothetical protein